MAVVLRHRFYSILGLVLALFVILAFSPTFYLRFLADLPPLPPLVFWHGVAFTAWLALFFTQTQLVARDRVDLHMRLGIAGLALAATIVVLGVLTTFHSAAVPRIRPSGLTPAQFSVVAFTGITQYAVFVALGAALRSRPALHKRFMVMAMVAVLGPATGRLLGFVNGNEFAYIVQPLVAATFVAWCLLQDWKRHHLVHPVFVICGFVVVASWPARMAVARSEWWQPVGDWVARVGAGI